MCSTILSTKISNILFPKSQWQLWIILINLLFFYLFVLIDHAYYRKWVILTDLHDINGGPKGFVKVDITVLGKGDNVKPPKKQTEDEDDIDGWVTFFGSPYRGFGRRGTHPYVHDFTPPRGFLFVWRSTEKNNKKCLNFLFTSQNDSKFLLSVCANDTLIIWYCSMDWTKSNRTFCCILLYCAMLRGNQHGSFEYDDLQNWLDMTSHENPLFQLEMWGTVVSVLDLWS